jgi:hypothetical protein
MKVSLIAAISRSRNDGKQPKRKPVTARALRESPIVNRQSKITQLLAQLIHSFRTFGLALPTLGASATMFLAHFLPLLLLFGREDFGNSIVRVPANHGDPSMRHGDSAARWPQPKLQGPAALALGRTPCGPTSWAKPFA